MKGETGSSLIETIVALALLGIIGVVFISAVATTATARLIADEHASARILAESRTEDIRKQGYASSYNATDNISAEYVGYSVNITVDNLRNGSIQKTTITVRHHGRDVTTLESYKVQR